MKMEHKLTMRLEYELLKHLSCDACDEQVPISWVVRRILRQYYKIPRGAARRQQKESAK